MSDDLRKLAEAATQHEGRWERTTNPNGDSHLLCRVDDEIGCFGETWGWCAEEAAYIAAADPSTILALLDERDRLRGLVTQAMHLAQHGERAPGGDETWTEWYGRARDALEGR